MVDPHVVDTWDDPSQGADWDSGLQWDVNVPESLGDPEQFLALVTSEHNKRPNFMAMVRAVVQPFADNMVTVGSFTGLFDLDVAVGEQLDMIGEWVGVTRNIAVPLDGVYFTIGDANLGFGSGAWFTTFDPISGLVVLSDSEYRTLIRARIARNQWDGTIPGAYAIWAIVFEGTGLDIIIIDQENMHMTLALLGTDIDAVTLALFRGGYLSLKPEGVAVTYITPTVPGAPYFGFGIDNEFVAGFGEGAWGAS